ncbi:MAG: ATP-binding cassette domain-containing protein [Chloroflexi bacterium]|nr:ATP-binding cassette domain-containing protein [Chloroflexota bacterium]
MSALRPLLTLNHASKTYGGSPALIDASLELLPGEVHALMGENGAGKSTLIKILAGVIAPDRAEIAVEGVPVALHSTAEAFAHGLRFIHQELNVVPGLSVAENIFLSHPYPRRALVLVDWKRLNAAAREVLAALHIEHIDLRSKIARLTTGDQMLVKIASAFAGSLRMFREPPEGEPFQEAAQAGARELVAKVFVMDEPTAALTGAEADRLFAVIARLKAHACAVLYVTHRLDEVFAIADRVTVMRDGRVVAVRSIGETDSADLIRLMTGREISGVYPPSEGPVGEAAILRVHDLTTADLSGVTFELHAGEILGVAGLTGSGRSELLRALVGADRLTGGWVEVDPHPRPLSRAGGRGGGTRTWRGDNPPCPPGTRDASASVDNPSPPDLLSHASGEKGNRLRGAGDGANDPTHESVGTRMARLDNPTRPPPRRGEGGSPGAPALLREGGREGGAESRPYATTPQPVPPLPACVGEGVRARGFCPPRHAGDTVDPTAAWQSGIAYVPEERRTQGLILSRMIRDNVTLPHLGRFSGGGVVLRPGRETAETARLGESVRLKARDPGQTTRELSGGNQQKVLFARALAGEARILLLDEPTRGVDVGAKYDIYAVIRALSARGVGVILASSDLAELTGLCDRVVVLRARCQSAILDAAGLTQDVLLSACYGQKE